MYQVLQHYHLPKGQKPDRITDCAIRNVHIDGVTCIGENAMGVVGDGSNIKEITLKNIDYTRKPSKNLMLKGAALDLAPSTVEVIVPEDCGLFISGVTDIVIENVDTRQWKVINE